jgi:hypothetical protein
MTVFFGPLPASPIATTEHVRGWVRATTKDGVYDGSTSVFAGLLEATDGASLDVLVAAGECTVDGIYYRSDASQTQTLAAADVAEDRIDLVVIRLDPAGDGTVTLEAVQGTPGTPPAAPTVTVLDEGIFELALAEVTVPASSAVLGTITDVRKYIGSASTPTITVSATEPTDPATNDLWVDTA